MTEVINKHTKTSNTFSSIEHLDFEMKLPYLPKKMQELVGDGTAQNYFMLGYLFDTDIQDTEQAIFWYSKAASLGHTIAKLNLGILYETGYQGNIQPDYNLAINWYSMAVEAGHTGAIFNLGRLVWSGKGITQSYTQAFRLFRMAAKKGNNMAMTNIGSMYMFGNGVNINYTLAIKWLTRAATNNYCCVAHHNLGIMYENGWGVNKDIEKANVHFRLATSGTNNPVSKTLSDQLRKTRETLLFT